MSNRKLWAVVQCAMSQFKREHCYIHEKIVERGWRGFMDFGGERSRMATIARERPLGVIFHLPRGMKYLGDVTGTDGVKRPKVGMNFVQRELMGRSSGAVGLEATLPDFYEMLREIQAMGTLAVAYEGVPPAVFEDMTDDAIESVVAHELVDPATREFVWDGVILDGWSDGPEDLSDARGRLARVIDTRFRPRLATGGEAIANKDSEAVFAGRMSLTMAGLVDPNDPDQWRMGSGAYDPEATTTGEGAEFRLHGARARLAKVNRPTGPAIVWDAGVRPGGDEQKRRRAELILTQGGGCDLCVELENLDGKRAWLEHALRVV